MSTVAQLRAVISIDDKQFQQGIKRSEDSLQSFAKKATVTGAALTVGVTAPLVMFGKSAVTAASDINEQMSKVGVVFGRSGEQIKRFAATASTSIGLSTREAATYAGTLGNLFRTIGIGEQATADMSVSLLKLGADFSSFNNLAGGAGEALEKIRSGLAGEAEPLRALGVFLSEDAVKAQALAMGLGGAHKELTEGEKVQARYALIMKQSGLAQGDFARTSGELQGSLRKANAEFDNAVASLGKELLPMVKSVTIQVTEMLKQFNAMPDSVKGAIVSVGLLATALGPIIGAAGSIAQLFAMLKIGKIAGTLGGGAAALGGGAAALGIGTGVAVGGAVAATVGTAWWAGSAIGNDIAGAMGRTADRDMERKFGGPTEMGKLWNARAAARTRAKGPGGAAGTSPRAAASLFSDEDQMGISDARYQSMLEQAQYGAGTTAAGELRALQPTLTGRLSTLSNRGDNLRAKAQSDPKAAKEYFSLEQEYWQIKSQLQDLQRAADEEIKSEREKAIEKAKSEKARQVADAERLREGRARAIADYAKATGTEMQLSAQLASEVLADLKNTKPGTDRFYELQSEYWKLVTSQQEMAKTATEKAKSQQERAFKVAQEAARGQQELAGGIVGLAKERIANTPGLNAQDRQRALLPFLKEQFRALSSGIPGESPQEAIRRMTQAEGLRGDILSATGASATLGGYYDRRRYGRESGELDAIARSGAGIVPGSPRSGGNGQTVIFNIPMGSTTDTIIGIVRGQLDQLQRQVAPPMLSVP